MVQQAASETCVAAGETVSFPTCPGSGDAEYLRPEGAGPSLCDLEVVRRKATPAPAEAAGPPTCGSRPDPLVCNVFRRPRVEYAACPVMPPGV